MSADAPSCNQDTPPRPTALPVHVSGIPHELRQRAQWCVWCYTWKPDKGYWDKPPRAAASGVVIGCTAKQHWASFAAANTAMATRQMDGLGYCLSDDDPLTIVDLDECRDPATGALAPDAEAIMDALGGYWEVSPSGAGLRGVVRATLPGPGCNRSHTWATGQPGRWELYSRDKYLTLTGHTLREVETIPEAQAAIDTLYADIIASTSAASDNNQASANEPAGAAAWTPSPPLDDDTILAKAREAKNAAAFVRLWDGDARDYVNSDGQVDESRADAGLLERLTFWTQDRDQLDRLYRASGLMRPKWENRADYRAMTLDFVLSKVRETWQPAERLILTGTAARNGYAPHNGLGGGGGDGEPPDDGGDIPTDAPAEARPCTDLGNSERLLDRYGRDLLYCAALPDGWLTWADGCWRSDATRRVYELAKATVRAIYDEATAAPRASERKELAQWAVRSEAAGKLEALVNLARSAVAVEAGTFDADPWLLNVANGVIDLRTGRLLPHRRALYLTKQAPVAYDPEAVCPRWDQFILEIFSGDATLAAFLQRAIGYSLTGDTRERVLFALHGRGRNGKDTLLEIVTALLGDYALRTPAETLLSREKDRGRIPEDVAALRGARFVPASETDEGRWLSEARVKELTGAQTVSARHLYGRQFNFIPECKLWLATNHRPVVRGTDDGIWDRIRLLPFDVRFYLPWEERPPDAPAADLDLKATLRQELPGILAWAVRGCLAWQREGLGMPEAVQKANTAYRADMDVLAPFVDECCVIQPNAHVAIAALYKAYVKWCEESGEKPLGQRQLGNRLTERGCDRYRGTGGEWRWIGIGLQARDEK